MSFETVTVTWDERDVALAGLTGTITFEISGPLSDPVSGQVVEPQPPASYSFSAPGSTAPLVANDSPGAVPGTTFYNVTVNVNGTYQGSFQVRLLRTLGAVQSLGYLRSQVPADWWETGAIVSVISVNGKTGAVVLVAADVGADPAGTAATAVAAVLATVGQANGIASLDGSSHVPAAQLGLALLLAGGVMNGPLSPKVTILTDQAQLAIDAADGNLFRVTLGGNRNFAVPLNPVDGEQFTVEVIQDVTGGRVPTWATGVTDSFSFGATGQPSLSSAAGAMDVLSFRYNIVKRRWVFLGIMPGY